MANAVVGTLRALLTADTAQFESGMRRASVITGQFGTATKAAEAPTTALSGKMVALSAAAGAMAATLGIQAARALVSFGKEAVKSAGHLVDLRDKTGESLTSLQRMQHVADQTGTSLDAMTNAAFQLRTRLAGGSGSVNKALDDLRRVSGEAGLSVRSSADQILTALSQVQDEQERQRLGNLLFGRSFRELAGAVTSGYKDIADGAKTSSDAQIQALSDAGDAWDAFVRDRKTQFRSLLGEMVINARELADIFSNQGLFGGAIGASLEFQRRQQMGLIAGRRTDIQLTTGAIRDLNTQTGNTAVETDKAAEAWARFSESVRGATFGVQVMLRDLKVMPPAIDSMNVSLDESVTQLDSYSAAWRDTRITMDGLITAVPTLGARIDESTRIVEDASQEVVEFRSRWNAAVEGIGERLTQSISDSFGDMLVGLRSFKDGFLNIWRSIQQALSNILSEMLQGFISNFLQGMLKAIGAAKLGQALGNAVAGGAAGAAIGGGAAAAAGGGAAAGGAGATLAGLATNPITIAAAAALGLGLLIGKKGVFRGGEEALQVNPRRDQFLRQFGPAGTGPNSGFALLAAQLTAWSGQSGGGPLFSAMRTADTLNEWKSAQSAIVAEYAKHGFPDVESFRMGGFVPPGVVQPAILHGGSHGEMIVPLDRPPADGPTILNINAHIRAWDSRDVAEAFRSQIIPQVKQALLLNTDGFVTAHQRAGIVGKR